VRSLSDESLLAGLGSSDPDGSAAFVRRFQGRVYGLAMAIVGDPSMAEEVAQEAFMRAWRHAATFDPSKGRVITLLLRITRNVAVDALRMRRQVPVDPDVLIGLPADSGSDPEAQGVLAHESQVVLRGQLADPSDREVLHQPNFRAVNTIPLRTTMIVARESVRLRAVLWISVRRRCSTASILCSSSSFTVLRSYLVAS
jgi:RNA polymerase sigma factor (sigma-70 family)